MKKKALEIKPGSYFTVHAPLGGSPHTFLALVHYQFVNLITLAVIKMRPEDSFEVVEEDTHELIMVKKPEATPSRTKVIVQRWEESEAGWGTRPDGVSIHLTELDRIAFCERHWVEENKRSNGVTPEEYSRENGKPFTVEVGPNLLNQLANSKDKGIRFWNNQWQDLQKSNEVFLPIH